jgi:hypothetical protein
MAAPGTWPCTEIYTTASHGRDSLMAPLMMPTIE